MPHTYRYLRRTAALLAVAVVGPGIPAQADAAVAARAETALPLPPGAHRLTAAELRAMTSTNAAAQIWDIPAANRRTIPPDRRVRRRPDRSFPHPLKRGDMHGRTNNGAPAILWTYEEFHAEQQWVLSDA